jgi:hypothetical protein
MRKLLFVVAAVAMLSPVAIAVADPNLPNVPRHRHFVETPTGDRVEVGPRVCDDAGLQDAFNQFHNNVHRPFRVPAGEVLGPDQGAPGLHNDRGGELTATPC